MCRRWERLLYEPKLLQEMYLDVRGPGGPGQLRSFVSMLLRRAAASVQSLCLFVTAPEQPEEEGQEPAEVQLARSEDCAEMLLNVAAAVAGRAAAGGLAGGSSDLSLCFTSFPPIQLPCWAFAGLHRLRSLSFSSKDNMTAPMDEALLVTGPLSPLTALQELSLCLWAGSTLIVEPSAVFPAQLTYLELGELREMAALPHQARLLR